MKAPRSHLLACVAGLWFAASCSPAKESEWPSVIRPLQRLPSHVLVGRAPKRPVEGALRASVDSSFVAALEDLPVAPAAAAQREPTKFALARRGGSCSLVVEGRLAELSIGPQRFQTGGTPSAGLPASECPGGAATVRASLQSFNTRGWSADHLDVRIQSANLDLKTHEGVTTTGSTVRAKALVPFALYAFRACTSGCSSGGGAREEDLVLIGPPAQWVSASVDAESQQHPRVGEFTIVSLPIREGTSASALMASKATTFREFLLRRTSVPSMFRNVRGTDALTLTVEVAWLESSSPEIIGFVSRMSPAPEDLGVRRTSPVYTFDENEPLNGEF